MPLVLPEGYSWQKEGMKGQGHHPPSRFIRKTDAKIQACTHILCQAHIWAASQRDSLEFLMWVMRYLLCMNSIYCC